MPYEIILFRALADANDRVAHRGIAIHRVAQEPPVLIVAAVNHASNGRA